MSRPPKKILAIDAGVILGLSAVHAMPTDQIGAAITIVSWMARGYTPTDEAMRRVARYGRAKWRTHRDGVLFCVKALIDASEVRAQYSRPTLSAARREAIFERDGKVCRYCEATEGPFHIDHMMPLARGGSNRDENLCVACAPCNFAKAAKVGSEWNY